METSDNNELSISYEKIARDWYAEIAPTAYSPHGKTAVEDKLALMAKKATELLLADTYVPAEAEQIGQSLVSLNYSQGDALGKSLKLISSLGQLLPNGISKTDVPVRLGMLLGDIANGFFKKASATLLKQQETIREAQLEALNEMYAELLAQEEKLRKSNDLLQKNLSERDEIAAELSASEEQFRALFRDAPIALWLFDGSRSHRFVQELLQAGTDDVVAHMQEHPDVLLACVQRMEILARNQKAEAIAAATSRSNLLQTPPGDMARHGSGFAMRMVEAMASGQTQLMDSLDVIMDDDRMFTTMYQWSVPQGYQEPYSRMILGIIDITAQARAEKQLRLTAERLQTLLEIESGILAAQSAEAIAGIAVGQISQIIPCQSVVVVKSDRDGQAYKVLADDRGLFQKGADIPFALAMPREMDLLLEGNSVVYGDLEVIENRSPGLDMLLSANYRSLLAVPLMKLGEMVGILSLAAEEKNAFSDEHCEIALQIAASLAVALYNIQLLETEKKARQESEILRQVAVGLSSSIDQNELLQYILFQLSHVLPYDGAVILLQENGSTRVGAQRGYDQRVVEALHSLEQPPPNMRRLMDQRKALIISDTRLEPDWLTLSGSEHVRCWLGVPLISQGTLTGILALSKTEPNSFTEDSAELAEAFANQVSVVIDNARLYHEVEASAANLRDRVVARTRELESLYAIAAVTSEMKELDTVLETALARILGDLGCPSGAVHVLDDAGLCLKLVAAGNLNSNHTERIREVDTTCEPIRRIIFDRETIIIGDLSGSQFREHMLPEGACCYAGAPIVVRGDVIGTLSLYGNEPHVLTPEEMKLLTSVAGHMGVAIDNANLRRQAEKLAVLKARERLARELHDSATQSLFSLTLFATAARDKLRADQLDRALQYLDDIRYTANQTHREMRLLLYEIGSPDTDEEALIPALERRLRAVEGRSGVNAKFYVPHTLDLNAETEPALYQIATEALNNALKHAGATEVAVEIVAKEGYVVLSVIDNGQGFEPSDPGSSIGMGLANMRMRASRRGGQLAVDASPGQGTRVVARLPMESSTRT